MNIHNNTPFRHQVMNPKKKKREIGAQRRQRKRDKPVTILRPAVTELETDSDRA